MAVNCYSVPKLFKCGGNLAGNGTILRRLKSNVANPHSLVGSLSEVAQQCGFLFLIGGDGKLNDLTVKQKKFADEYITSGNAYQSALKVGYSEKYAKARSSELLENVGIKSYIAERLAELEKQKIAKQDEVLQVLTAILRQELTEEVVQFSSEDGRFFRTTKKPSIAEVIKAAVELMKRHRFSLEEEKLEQEIAKLKSQVAGDDIAENLLKDYFEGLEEIK